MTDVELDLAVKLLREAAQTMRERANAATPGPWVREWAFSTHFVVPDAARDVASGNVSRLKSNQRADAAHIASWHPAVALAVADWLNMHAADMADANGYVGACDSPGDMTRALAVARVFLGRAEQ